MKTSLLRAFKEYECWLPACKRPIKRGQKITLIGAAHGGYLPMHQRHAKHLNFLTRLRLWGSDVPDVGRLPKEDELKHEGFTVYARYALDVNRICVAEAFWTLRPVEAVYVLSHETVHYILGRDLGFVASRQFDGLYHRALPCLRGKSMFRFELDRLYCSPLSEPSDK